MLNRGIPETPEEALEITSLIADQTPNDPVPPHWPHSQVVAIAQVVRTQQEIIAVLAEQVELVLARCDKLKDKLIELAGTTDGMEDEPPAASAIADSTDPDESALSDAEATDDVAGDQASDAEATDDVAGDQASDEPTPEPKSVAKRGGRQRVAA